MNDREGSGLVVLLYSSFEIAGLLRWTKLSDDMVFNCLAKCFLLLRGCRFDGEIVTSLCIRDMSKPPEELAKQLWVLQDVEFLGNDGSGSIPSDETDRTTRHRDGKVVAPMLALASLRRVCHGLA